MLRREKNIKKINELLNKDGIREFITLEGQDALDLTEALKNDKNIFLMDSKNLGGFAFHCISEGSYEAHPQFLPEARGKYAFNAALEAMKYMFTATDCFEIYAVAPIEYKNSKLMANYCGFEKQGRIERAKVKNTQGIYDVYVLTFDKWRQKWQQERWQEQA